MILRKCRANYEELTSLINSLLNQYGKSCRQPSPDSVKLTVTLLLVTQLVSPLIW